MSIETNPQRVALLEINEMVIGASDIFPDPSDALAAIGITASEALSKRDGGADQTVRVLRSFQSFAEENGAIVDRIEVVCRKVAEGLSVEFTAHLEPQPLSNGSKACLGYIIPAGAMA